METPDPCKHRTSFEYGVTKLSADEYEAQLQRMSAAFQASLEASKAAAAKQEAEPPAPAKRKPGRPRKVYNFDSSPPNTPGLNPNVGPHFNSASAPSLNPKPNPNFVPDLNARSASSLSNPSFSPSIPPINLRISDSFRASLAAARAAAAAAAEAADEPPPVKRKVGRPRKVKSSPAAAEAVVEPPPVKRKVGRPRKAQTSPAAASTHVPDLNAKSIPQVQQAHTDFEPTNVPTPTLNFLFNPDSHPDFESTSVPKLLPEVNIGVLYPNLSSFPSVTHGNVNAVPDLNPTNLHPNTSPNATTSPNYNPDFNPNEIPDLNYKRVHDLTLSPLDKPSERKMKRGKYTNWFSPELWPRIEKAVIEQESIPAALQYLRKYFRYPGSPEGPYSSLSRANLYRWFDEEGKLRPQFQSWLKEGKAMVERKKHVLADEPNVLEGLVELFRGMNARGEPITVTIAQPIIVGYLRFAAPHVFESGFSAGREWTRQFLRQHVKLEGGRGLEG